MQVKFRVFFYFFISLELRKSIPIYAGKQSFKKITVSRYFAASTFDQYPEVSSTTLAL